MLGILLELTTSSPILIAIALVLIFGYIALAIFRRTKIPEILILMFIGILIVRFGFVAPGTIITMRSFAPLFGSLALVVIMFNGSRKLKFDRSLMTNWKGGALGILDTLLPMALISAFMYYVFQWPPIYGALLGTILGDTTSLVVIPFIRRVKLDANMFNTLFIETTMNSLVAIVTFSIILVLVNAQAVTAYSSTSYILDYIGVSVLVGIVAGFVWVFVLSYVKSAREYLATIAIALLVYGIVDVFNGAAVIAVMIFGLIVGNERILAAPMKLNVKIRKTGERSVEKELEFLITTFFFVFMGMIVVFSTEYLIYGVVIAAVLLLIRFAEGRIVLYKNTKEERDLFFALLPRGLTAATLASILYGIGGVTYYSQIFYISFMVIVITSILSSLLLNRTKLEIAKKRATVPA